MKRFIVFFTLFAIFASCRKGDSSTHSNSDTTSTSPGKVNNTNGFTILNKGHGGDNTQDLLDRVDTSVLTYKPDLVIIMIGTNDATPKKAISLPVFKKNYEKLIEKVVASGSDLLLLSPPPIDSIQIKSNSYKKIDTIATVVKQLASTYNVGFVDIKTAFIMAGSPNETSGSLIRNPNNCGVADGVHPVKEGYVLIAHKVFDFIKSQNKKYSTIICFGDSITFGNYMIGQGTTDGNTYPAVLKQLLLL